MSILIFFVQIHVLAFVFHMSDASFVILYNLLLSQHILFLLKFALFLLFHLLKFFQLIFVKLSCLYYDFLHSNKNFLVSLILFVRIYSLKIPCHKQYVNFAILNNLSFCLHIHLFSIFLLYSLYTFRLPAFN